MFGELKDLTIESCLVDLPSTVNYNNEVVKNEFNYIFDASNNELCQSLKNNQGYVKAHWGEFVNLRVSNLIIDNGTQDLDDEVEVLTHEDTVNRFSWELESLPKISTDEINNYAHDVEMIVSWADASNPIEIGSMVYTSPITLKQELSNIETLLTGLAKNITIKENGDLVSEAMVGEMTGSDPVIEDSSLTYYGSYDETFQEEVQRRLTSIEKRLTNIEYRLDTKEI